MLEKILYIESNFRGAVYETKIEKKCSDNYCWAIYSVIILYWLASE